MRVYSRSICEIIGLTLGIAATLVVLTFGIAAVVLTKMLVNAVKLVCVPLVVLASVVFPDDRPVRERLVSDIIDWWKLTHLAL